MRRDLQQRTVVANHVGRNAFFAGDVEARLAQALEQGPIDVVRELAPRTPPLLLGSA